MTAAAIGGAALATWLTCRYAALGAELAAARHELSEHLRAAGAAGDAGGRIGATIEADELLFDHAVRLATAQRVTALLAGVAWVVVAIVAWRAYRAVVLRTGRRQ